MISCKDAGMSYHLSRMPYNLGNLMGIAGLRLKGISKKN